MNEFKFSIVSDLSLPFITSKLESIFIKKFFKILIHIWKEKYMFLGSCLVPIPDVIINFFINLFILFKGTFNVSYFHFLISNSLLNLTQSGTHTHHWI